MTNQDEAKLLRKGLLLVFGKVSSWILAPVFIAILAGTWLDHHLGTGHWMFISLMAVSFVVSMLGLVKEVLLYRKELEEAEKNK